jgi:hypothetical protein
MSHLFVHIADHCLILLHDCLGKDKFSVAIELDILLEVISGWFSKGRKRYKRIYAYPEGAEVDGCDLHNSHHIK